jgi:hypothetical protein
MCPNISGLPGHGDPPEAERHAAASEGRLDQIVVADRCPADGDDHVGGEGHGLVHGRRNGRDFVAGDPEIGRVAAQRSHVRNDADRVGRDDLIGPRRRGTPSTRRAPRRARRGVARP